MVLGDEVTAARFGDQTERNLDMKDIYQKLHEAEAAMTDSQRRRFWEKKPQGTNVEAMLNLAESILGHRVSDGFGKKRTESIREGAPIRRNNGPGSVAQPTHEDVMHENDMRLFRSMGMSKDMLARIDARPTVPEKIREAGPMAVADYTFLRALRFSEKDAIEGALENKRRPGPLSRRQLLQD